MPSNHNVKKPSPAKQSDTTYRHFALNDPCGENMTSKVICDNSHLTSKVIGGHQLHRAAPDICCNNNNSTQFIEDHFKSDVGTHKNTIPIQCVDDGATHRSFMSFISNRSMSPSNCSKNSSGIFCRICHEGDGMERLVSPCMCAGSMALVHKSCIEKWLSTANNDTCELCRHKYTVSRHPKPFRDWVCTPSVQEDQRNLVGDIICFSLLTPLASISTYLCATGAAFYYGEKKSESVGLIALCCVLVLIYLVWVLLTLKYHLQVWFTWRKTHQDIFLLDVGKTAVQAKNWRNNGRKNLFTKEEQIVKRSSDCEATTVPSVDVESTVTVKQDQQQKLSEEKVVDLDITDASFYIEADDGCSRKSFVVSPRHLACSPLPVVPLPALPSRSKLGAPYISNRTTLGSKERLDEQQQSNQQIPRSPRTNPRYAPNPKTYNSSLSPNPAPYTPSLPQNPAPPSLKPLPLGPKPVLKSKPTLSKSLIESSNQLRVLAKNNPALISTRSLESHNLATLSPCKPADVHLATLSPRKQLESCNLSTPTPSKPSESHSMTILSPPKPIRTHLATPTPAKHTESEKLATVNRHNSKKSATLTPARTSGTFSSFGQTTVAFNDPRKQ